MHIEICHGPQHFSITVDAAKADLLFARSKNPTVPDAWEAVVADALAAPINAAPIANQNLCGRKVTIITDDWGRPTPAYRAVPLLLDALAHTGVAGEDITFVTASGMHDPMSREDLARKLSQDVVARYRCVSHDGGDWSMLAFHGISSLGTPVWVNRYVAEADYRIGLGRVFPHITHGYEGGYKLILPGVVGFDTIVRDHSLNFAPTSVPGVPDNPSRAETDNVGRIVGIDFLINVVVNHQALPCKAFAGAVEPVYAQAVAYGDREVWGANVDRLADVALVAAGPGAQPASGFDTEAIRRACTVTKTGGTVIVVTDRAVPALPDWRAGVMANDAELDKLPRDEFGAHLRPLAFSEVMRLHERRDWPLPPREIQWRIKALRGEYYRRRWMMDAEERHVIFTQEPQKMLDAAIATSTTNPTIIILPEGRTTLPKVRIP